MACGNSYGKMGRIANTRCNLEQKKWLFYQNTLINNMTTNLLLALIAILLSIIIDRLRWIHEDIKKSKS